MEQLREDIEMGKKQHNAYMRDYRHKQSKKEKKLISLLEKNTKVIENNNKLINEIKKYLDGGNYGQ